MNRNKYEEKKTYSVSSCQFHELQRYLQSCFWYWIWASHLMAIIKIYKTIKKEHTYTQFAYNIFAMQPRWKKNNSRFNGIFTFHRSDWHEVWFFFFIFIFCFLFYLCFNAVQIMKRARAKAKREWKKNLIKSTALINSRLYTFRLRQLFHHSSREM